jgi:hypothetical protein
MGVFLGSTINILASIFATLYLLYVFSFVLVFIDAARHVRKIYGVMVSSGRRD